MKPSRSHFSPSPADAVLADVVDDGLDDVVDGVVCCEVVLELELELCVVGRCVVVDV